MTVTSRYDGHAFHDSLPKGRSSGEITVSNHAVRFEGGGQQVSIEFSQLELALGGASNRLVYLKDKFHADWTVYTSDRSILKNPDFLAHPELLKKTRQARNIRKGNWAMLATVVFLCVLAPVMLYLSMDVLTRLAADQVPPEWEASLGKTAFAQYSINYDLMKEEDAEALLNPVTNSLIQAAPSGDYTYKIYIANDESINAFALPGGYIVIHSGLILKADNAEEMLGVLAHEISHVTEKHGIRNIISALGTFLMVDLLLGDATGLLAMVADAAPILINQSYSRDFEREADSVGFELLEKAAIDPVGLRDFFYKIKAEHAKRMEKVSDENSRELLEAANQLLSTHPATDERIDAIQDLLDKRRVMDYQNTELAFIQLKEQVAQFVLENTPAEPVNDGESDRGEFLKEENTDEG